MTERVNQRRRRGVGGYPNHTDDWNIWISVDDRNVWFWNSHDLPRPLAFKWFNFMFSAEDSAVVNGQMLTCLPIKIQRNVAFTRRIAGPKQSLTSTCETKALPHRPCKMAETGTLHQRPSPLTYFTATPTTLRSSACNVNIHTCALHFRVSTSYLRCHLHSRKLWKFDSLKVCLIDFSKLGNIAMVCRPCLL